MSPVALETEDAWAPAGSLADGRHEHTATLLSDGRVLIVGGFQERTADSPGLASVEVYDPASGTWSVTGSLNSGRLAHTATLLPDGTVLVTGGRTTFRGPELASVEIYNPVSGIWNPGPSLSVARRSHSATRLADGRVLVAGGRLSSAGPDVHASAEIFDPVTGTWSPTGSLTTPRESHSATELPDGQVLVVNGYYQGALASAEVYDPVSGAWTAIAAPLACHGVAHTATLLPDGRVLVAGGGCYNGSLDIRNEAETYDPASSTWSPAAALPVERELHTATSLPDGTVLIVGGDDGDPPHYDSALVYDPASGIWSPTGSLATGRRNHTATLLDDGTVLVVGGWGDETTYLESAERYQWTGTDLPTPASSAPQTPLPPTVTHTPSPPASTATDTPLPPTATIAPPKISPPPVVLLITTTPPTEEPASDENLNMVALAVLAAVIFVGVTIGVVAVVGGIILYARSTRK